MKGRMLLRQGANADARAVLEDAKRLDPKNALVWVDLSTLFRNEAELQPRAGRRGDRRRARAEVARDARGTRSRSRRGRPRGRGGKDFEAALAVAPSYPDALYFLAAIHLRAGRADAAVPLLERLLKEAPDYPRGRELPGPGQGAYGAGPEGAVQLRLVRVRDRARAEDALRRARSGEDFAALARELSQDPSASRGGDLGLVRAADLAEPLRSAALPLAAGQLSALVETADGFVLLKRER